MINQLVEFSDALAVRVKSTKPIVVPGRYNLRNKLGATFAISASYG